MRNFILLLGLFFLQISHAQEFAVIHYKKQMDVVDLQHKDPEVLAMMRRTQSEMESNLEKITYELKIYRKMAKFQHLPVMQIEDRHSNRSLDLAISTADGAGETYTKADGKTIRDKVAYGSRFRISSDLNELDWKMTQESKMIMGYQCYKATTTVKLHNSSGVKDIPITAYFAPALSFPFGPAGYGKLPGLILELRKGKFVYYATEINLNPSIERIELPTGGKLVTRQEFDAMGEVMWNNKSY